MATGNLVTFLFGAGIGVLLLCNLIFYIISLEMNMVFFKRGLRVVKGKNTESKQVLLTTFHCSWLALFPCVEGVFCWFLIDRNHDTGFDKAILVWFIAKLITVIVAVLIIVGLIIIFFL